MRAAVGRGLGFDAPAVVSREFRCVSMLRCGFARIPLHFDAPPVVSRELRPLVASSGLFWGGHYRLPTATARAVRRALGFDAPAVVSREFRAFRRCRGFARIPLPREFRPLVASSGGATTPWFRFSRCGFARIPLRFDAPTVVSREFRCISMLALWFRVNSGLSWPLQAGPLD